MRIMNYTGLGVHKKTINYCVKDASGRIQRGRQDRVNPTRAGLLDEDSAPAVDRGDGGDDLQRSRYSSKRGHPVWVVLDGLVLVPRTKAALWRQ